MTRCCGLGRLHLDRDDAQLRLSDVLHVVRADRARPEGRADLRPGGHGARVQQDVPVRIAADEVAPAQDVQRGRPLVGMHRRPCAGPDRRVEDAHLFVFQENPVVVRCLRHGIERMHAARQRAAVIDVVHEAILRGGMPSARWERAQRRFVADQPNVPEWIDKPALSMSAPRHLIIFYIGKAAGCTCFQSACNHIIGFVNKQFDPCGRRTKLLRTIETTFDGLVQGDTRCCLASHGFAGAAVGKGLSGMLLVFWKLAINHLPSSFWSTCS